MAKISKSLNIVLVAEDCRVHSMPISRAVFEQYYSLIARTYATLAADGLLLMGPKVAYLRLRELAGDKEWLDVERGLVNEMIRLSNVLMPGESGWTQAPLETVITQKRLDEETIAEVMGQLVFFTCVSRAMQKDQVAPMLTTINGLWGSQTTSSSSTEFMSSLPTLIEAGNTGETAST